MATKPKTPKKGVVYFVEPIKTMTNDPTIKGDVFKKFINGKLTKQIFVSKNRMTKIIDNAKKKQRQSKFGQGKQLRTSKVTDGVKHPALFGGLTKKRTVKQQKVYVNRPSPPVYVNQQPPQGQIPVNKVYVEDTTTMGHVAKQGLAGGLGLFTAEAIINAITGNS